MKTRIAQWYSTQPMAVGVTVSNEGFGSLVGDLVRGFKHGRKKSIKAELDDKSVANLKTTYQNPEWLAKRRFVEGDVEFKGVLGVFAGDMEGNCDSLCRELEAAKAKNIRETKRLAGVAKGAIAFVISPAAKEEEKAKSYLKSSVLATDVIFHGYTGKLRATGVCKAPALCVDGVKMAIDYIMRLNNQRLTLDTMLDTPEWVKSFYEGKPGEYKPRFADGCDLLVQFERMESWSAMDLVLALDEFRYDVESMFSSQLQYTDLLIQDVIKTIISWIDASVK